MGLFFMLLEFRYLSFLVGKYGFATGLTTVSVFAVAAAVVVLTLPETKGKVLEVE